MNGETILKRYRNLFQAAGAAFLYGAGALAAGLGDELGVQAAVFLFRLFAYGLSAWNILLAAVRNLVAGKVLDEFFLMSVASLSAFILGEHAEAIAVMALFQVGEFFQGRAVERSRRSIAGVLAMRSDTAHVVTPEGMVDTHPSTVLPGSLISIRPGERVPLDGTVVEGSGYIDTSPVTGESLPRFARPGTSLYSGSINAGNRIAVRTTAAYEDSTASRIIRLVEGAGARKAASERFLSRFSRIYTPAVVAAALLLAFIPPLLFGGEFREWIYRGLVFLVFPAHARSRSRCP
jgi:Cd2+/Zn2+-exporting ATPase